MRILKQSLLALVLSSPAILSAQTAVNGTVHDNTNSAFIAGADVSNITTGNSTISDEKGNFTLPSFDENGRSHPFSWQKLMLMVQGIETEKCKYKKRWKGA